MPRRFGEKLRYVRQERGLSQSELARRLHLTQHSYITHLEAGRRTPSLKLVVRTAHMLCVSTDYFLQDTLPTVPLIEITHTASLPSFSHARLGSNVRALRTERGMTQTEMARHLQLRSQGYVSQLEAGKKEPAPDLLVAIAALFDVSTDQLLFEDDAQS